MIEVYLRQRGILALTVLASLSVSSFFIANRAGAETVTPTPVCTAQDLYNVRNNLSGNYIQTCDIDLSGYPDWTPLGAVTGELSGPQFVGTYDGAGKLIRNLSSTQGGLFGTIGANGIIKNVILNNVQVISNSVQIGALADALMSYGSISPSIINSSASGVVNATSVYNGLRVGGLVGYVLGGNIKNSYASVNVTGTGFIGGLVGSMHKGLIENSQANGNVMSTNELESEAAGGLVGGLSSDLNASASIRNSYATGNVTAKGILYAGGLIGAVETDSNGPITIDRVYASGSVTQQSDGAGPTGGLIGIISCFVSSTCPVLSNAYATGNVYGTKIGGLIGYSQLAKVQNVYASGKLTFSPETFYQGGGLIGSSSASSVVSSYWDTQTSGFTTSAGGLGKTTAQMQTASTYAGWDFVNVWKMPLAGVYPVLKNVGTVPMAILSASPTSITSGQSSILTWSSVNAASCTASGGWTGIKSTNGMASVTPQLTTTYTLGCTGTIGSSVPVSAVVAVAAGATCTFNGQTVASGASVTAYQSSSVGFTASCASQVRSCTSGTLSGTYQYGSCTAPTSGTISIGVRNHTGTTADAAEFTGSSNDVATYTIGTSTLSDVRPWIGYSSCPTCGTTQRKQRFVASNLQPGQRYRFIIYPAYASSNISYDAKIVAGAATLNAGQSKIFATDIQGDDPWVIELTPTTASITLEVGNVAMSGSNYLYLDQVVFQGPVSASLPATVGTLNKTGAGTDWTEFLSGSDIATYTVGVSGLADVRASIGFSNCASCSTKPTKQRFALPALIPGKTYRITIYPAFSSSNFPYEAKIISGSATITAGQNMVFPAAMYEKGTYPWVIEFTPSTTQVTIEVDNRATSGVNYLYFDQILFSDATTPTVQCGTLGLSQSLAAGQSIQSCGTGAYRFSYSTGGDLSVLNTSGQVLWHAGTNTGPSQKLVMQSDGDLVLYNTTTPVWSTFFSPGGTKEQPGALWLNADGTIKLSDNSTGALTGLYDANGVLSEPAVLTMQDDGNATVLGLNDGRLLWSSKVAAFGATQESKYALPDTYASLRGDLKDQLTSIDSLFQVDTTSAGGPTCNGTQTVQFYTGAHDYNDIARAAEMFRSGSILTKGDPVYPDLSAQLRAKFLSYADRLIATANATNFYFPGGGVLGWNNTASGWDAFGNGTCTPKDAPNLYASHEALEAIADAYRMTKDPKYLTAFNNGAIFWNLGAGPLLSGLPTETVQAIKDKAASYGPYALTATYTVGGSRYSPSTDPSQLVVRYHYTADDPGYYAINTDAGMGLAMTIAGAASPGSSYSLANGSGGAVSRSYTNIGDYTMLGVAGNLKDKNYGYADIDEFDWTTANAPYNNHTEFNVFYLARAAANTPTAAFKTSFRDTARLAGLDLTKTVSLSQMQSDGIYFCLLRELDPALASYCKSRYQAWKNAHGISFSSLWPMVTILEPDENSSILSDAGAVVSANLAQTTAPSGAPFSQLAGVLTALKSILAGWGRW